MKRKMNLLRPVLLAVALVGCLMPARAYHDPDFDAQVKSLDEFMARFNGDEVKPGTNDRGENLLALFDFTMQSRAAGDSLQALVTDFVRAAQSMSKPLALCDAGAYAEVRCAFKRDGKPLTLTLVMQQESIDDEQRRWAIAGVRGLEKAGYYGDADRLTISPVDHEVHFMSLDDLLGLNHKLAAALRPMQRDIDELSMFLGLVVAGVLKFDRVDDVVFHFVDVPGFLFTVEELGRKGNNSGWLITKLWRAGRDEKQTFINHLFGYKDETD